MEAHQTPEQQSKNAGLESIGGNYRSFDLHIYFNKITIIFCCLDIFCRGRCMCVKGFTELLCIVFK